jgi:hypothetical protein
MLSLSKLQAKILFPGDLHFTILRTQYGSENALHQGNLSTQNTTMANMLALHSLCRAEIQSTAGRL